MFAKEFNAGQLSFPYGSAFGTPPYFPDQSVILENMPEVISYEISEISIDNQDRVEKEQYVFGMLSIPS